MSISASFYPATMTYMELDNVLVVEILQYIHLAAVV